jgi:hypothetical protein
MRLAKKAGTETAALGRLRARGGTRKELGVGHLGGIERCQKRRIAVACSGNGRRGNFSGAQC